MARLDDMAVFAAVVEAGGFTAAAKRLDSSKQSMSDRIAKLEGELGVRLIERTSRSMRLTDAGHCFYQHCASIVAQAEEATQEVQARRAEPTGVLRLSSSVAFGHTFLADLIAEFLRQWRNVKVEAVFADRPVHLIDEGFDLAFWFARPATGSFVAKRIGHSHGYFVASPSYLSTHGEPTRESELTDARCIGWPPTPWTSTEGKVLPIDPCCAVNSAEAARTVALAGTGIARLPGVLISAHVQRGDLRVLFGGKPAFENNIYAIYASRHSVPPKIRCFVDLVRARLASVPTFHEPSAEER